ncbi:MAG: hypothetical protein KJ626_05325, partial [Verrucomicrobia bacterium]|nr:hypothetical protein [Verrucomicrobiota bacterium]
MRKRPYPPMVARRHEEVYSRLVSALGDKSKWLVFSCTTVALLTFVYFLGQLRAIGDSPFHAGILNACILACALLLIRFVPFRRNLGLFIFGISIISRILIFGMDPSDDVYRYIWEGRVQNAGFSPYALSPDSDQLVHLRDDNWTRINHKDKTAIYPPGASLLFRGLARFTDNPYVFKAATVAADLLTVLFILMMLRTVKRREEWA